MATCPYCGYFSNGTDHVCRDWGRNISNKRVQLDLKLCDIIADGKMPKAIISVLDLRSTHCR